MPHLIAPLVLAGLLALPGEAPTAVRVPEVTVHTERAAEVYVPIKYAPVEHAEPELSLDTVRPTEWQPRIRRCARRGRRRFCDGPRMVPVPHGPAAERAERLGLGTPRAISQLMFGRPDPAWVEAISSKTHGSMHFPVDGGRIGRGVGYVRRTAIRHVRHDGVDIGAMPGAAVRSVEDGIVAYADNGLSGYGNLVVVVHPDGSITLYAHLRAAYVFAGQLVQRGQTIGELGNTGLSYGPHLHFEWRVNGRVRNPIPQFEEIPEPAPLDESAVALASAS